MTETWRDETVTVLSNGESGNGMTNTPGHFNVRLPKATMLAGMEVAVRNITYINFWIPVPLKDRMDHTPQWCVTVEHGSRRFPETKANVSPQAKWIKERTTMLFVLQNSVYKTSYDVVAQTNDTSKGGSFT